MIALTSHASPSDQERSRRAGFDFHLAKFNRETLLRTISESVAQRSAA
jgi:two-component system, chemotaxis family, sensor kinase CheA